MPSMVKLTSLNITGINNNILKKQLLALTKRIGTEIPLLQETYQKREVIPLLNKRCFLFQIHTTGSSRARGMAILLHKSLRYQEIASLKDKEGHYVVTKGLLNNQMTTIASVYAPTVGQITY